ncbi:MAG: hypothetical protein P4L40_05125 [Terracidiphilus sp.]|nr:hypothetical protein [Terracidiphilus sp.]
MCPPPRLERVEKFLSTVYWADINVSGAAYGPRSSAAVRLARFSPKDIRPTFEMASRACRATLRFAVDIA